MPSLTAADAVWARVPKSQDSPKVLGTFWARPLGANPEK